LEILPDALFVDKESTKCYALVALLTWLASATTLAALCLSFAFPPSLWTFVVSAPPSLRQDASFLYFTIEPLQCKLERIA